jgi:hypothetical protein
MADIVSFLQDHSVFDPDAMRAMSIAFEQACAALGMPETRRQEREIIATRIIELARRGERDSCRLRDHVLKGMGTAASPVGASRC